MTGAVLAAVALWIAGSPCAPAREVEEGQLIDLTALTADVDASAPVRLPRDLILCDTGETPGPALLGTVRLGALIFSRDHTSAEPSAKVFRATDDHLLLDANDMGLGTATGVDLTLLTAISATNELEFRYFGIDGWHGSETANSPPDGVRLTGYGVSLSSLGQRFDYYSRLYNVEFNFRPRVSEGIPLILGFRSMQLHERFEVWRFDDEPPATLQLGTGTRNFLYGFQIGAEPYLGSSSSPLRLEGLAKAGIYLNHAYQGTFSQPLEVTTIEATRNRSAFVGELGLMLDYRFSRFLAARAGYEMLWITGVALAPNQSGTTDLLVPSATIQCSGTAFYQGATAALEFVF